MGASAETLMNKIKQDNLISLDFICTKGLVNVYQHPDTKSYYAKVNEILLHNGYAEGNFKSSRIQQAKLKYPTVCVSRETHPVVLHARPTVYIELTSSSLNSLASVYPGIELDHTLSLIPVESSNNTIDDTINNNTDSINLKNIIKSFEEAVAELSIENNNLKNELEKERERFKNNLIEVSIHVKNINKDLENFVKTFNDLISARNHVLTCSEVLYQDLSALIREESNGNNDVDKEGENNGNQ
jgi:hypothetical protein